MTNTQSVAVKSTSARLTGAEQHRATNTTSVFVSSLRQPYLLAHVHISAGVKSTSTRLVGIDPQKQRRIAASVFSVSEIVTDPDSRASQFSQLDDSPMMGEHVTEPRNVTAPVDHRTSHRGTLPSPSAWNDELQPRVTQKRNRSGAAPDEVFPVTGIRRHGNQSQNFRPVLLMSQTASLQPISDLGLSLSIHPVWWIHVNRGEEPRTLQAVIIRQTVLSRRPDR